MFFKNLSGKEKSNDIRIDANKFFKSMPEDEVYLSPPMLFLETLRKSGGNGC